MKAPITLPIEELVAEPYASVVCYPRASPSEMHNRIEELRKLGVQAVEFSGKSFAFTLPVLGKGYVGVVAVAYVDSAKYALKMQRVDSDRESLEREADLLAKANSVGVGPKLIGGSKRFLLMKLVDGDLFEVWLENHRDAALVRKVLTEILEQCWRLDEIGLDHGELSKAPKHLLMDKADNPFIVDFETASTQRNASNVTSICQFLFQSNSNVSKSIAQIIGERNRSDLVAALRNYRKKRSRPDFETLLKQCLK